jgi:hypothetical protein
MSLNTIASMLSNRSGLQQSVSTAVMSTVMSYMMQNMMHKGIGSFFHSKGNNKADMKSAISDLQSGVGSSNQHELVQQVQQNAGIQDPSQAQQYTQHALGVLDEHTDSNPQQLSTTLGNFMEGSSNYNTNQGSQQEQGLRGFAKRLGF